RHDESFCIKGGLSSAARGVSPPASNTYPGNTVNQQLRSHQHLVDRIMQAISANETEVRDVLAAVTPGGGQKLLAVSAASRLIRTGITNRVVWIVPRQTLKSQAEEAFADASWRTSLRHALSVRAADNTQDPSRGLAGYVTTYQAVAAAPAL